MWHFHLWLQAIADNYGKTHVEHAGIYSAVSWLIPSGIELYWLRLTWIGWRVTTGRWFVSSSQPMPDELPSQVQMPDGSVFARTYCPDTGKAAGWKPTAGPVAPPRIMSPR